MPRGRSEIRLLIYSHDSFGLGHLKRCRAIAHSLVEHRQDVSVLILSGSPIIGSFDFRSRVDFVRIPGVIKLRNGGYTPLGLDIGVEEAVAIRESIIRTTADVFAPDIILVDKEPLGLRGEAKSTLEMLKKRGTQLVLGLRDVMDSPEALAEEWRRKNAVSVLSDLYDHIWVYGLESICEPLKGIDVPPTVYDKLSYTGYLRRTSNPVHPTHDIDADHLREPYILVTPGGGGDGAGLVDWVLRAYEHDPGLPVSAFIVFGPFMHIDLQNEFKQRVDMLPRVHATTFDTHLESLVSNAIGVIGMGGYNTFCEILSFDKPSLIVPRTVPRLEQYIRASRAEELGLVTMLVDDGERDPIRMAAAITNLPTKQKPSEVHIPGLLDGLSSINGAIDQWFNYPRPVRTPLTVVGQES